jgi:hypothetical protein
MALEDEGTDRKGWALVNDSESKANPPRVAFTVQGG